MIYGLLKLFYDFNKWGLMVYWVFYIKALFRGSVELYAFMMFLVSFLYMVSSLVWFFKKRTFPKIRDGQEYDWSRR